MKVTVTIELNVPEDTTAGDIERFVRRIRSDVEWAYKPWSPKVSVDPLSGVERGDARDTAGR